MKPSALLAFCSLAICCNRMRGEQPAAESAGPQRSDAARALPRTQVLEATGDLAEQMVAGIDRFLLREIESSLARRAKHWQRDFSSPEKYATSIEPNRLRLARRIGAVDPREKIASMELVATTDQPALVGRGSGCEAYRVRWPVFRGVTSEGLLLLPTAGPTLADVVAVPDADQSPEMLAGLAPGVAAESQFARRLAESGCRVLIPAMIDRTDTYSALESGERKNNQTHREFLYRPAFELGRHIIGYEVQKVLAAVDWFEHDAAGRKRPIGVAGYGEGGLIALDAAALDPRIDAALVSGYFDSRQNVWQEPLYRNVFGLLDEFGDAELASLVTPRALVVEACRGPEIAGPPAAASGVLASAAPGRLTTPSLASVEAELARARSLTKDLQPAPVIELLVSHDGSGPCGTPAALAAFLHALDPSAQLKPAGNGLANLAKQFDSGARLKRLFDQIEADTQHLMREAEARRAEFWSKADRQSRDAGKWQASTQGYRDYFAEEVIGRFDRELAAKNARTRQVYDEPKYTGYEVVLDVFPDVFAYGILLLPKDLRPGERRPVVVCQHGLESRAQDVADPQGPDTIYHRFGCRLAEQGFVVYAPQNPYIFHDKFRSLQRKANPLKKTLFSIIVPQHRQTVAWLASLPQVDPARIAFYGLSYGGKTAMRVPPLVDGYCLSICSADFNEWIWKNASTRSDFSYVPRGEYEIFEFDLGNTFNYAEMAALIAPRPFMVERGHRDSVAPDTWVHYEFAKVRLLYADLKIPDRARLETFDGPHEIHGVGTFEFLHEQLHWPAPGR